MSRTEELINITAKLVVDKKFELDTFQYEHFVNMFDKMEEMGDEFKVNRWLGFIHGVLVMEELYTIDEIKEACKPR